uniref:uncharacterized protein LOC120340907 isoform X1 n=1 Tax=Styela clava TaxID=7725 RepID=UPI00193AC9F6|nr:uncharacterized protein LOC120340907 isoform X1 [Styela clava]
MDNKTVRDMMKMFLACQRCSQLSRKLKQLKCSHSVCSRCALRNRTRNLDAGAWMLECVTCGRVDIWRDDNEELSGLTDNLLMQQMMKQSETQQEHFSEYFNGMIHTSTLNYSSHLEKEKHTRNIVTAVKEKIEIQEALQYAEKQMMKCQQQSRYLKSYEKRVDSVKNAMTQKIHRSTELLIANVMQEKLRLLNKLEDMFCEEMEPVMQAKENIQKQNNNIKMLTRCCDVATKMLQEGNSAMDMIGFKHILQKSINNTKEYALPPEIKRKYKTNITLACNEDEFETIVRNYVHIESKVACNNEMLKQSETKSDCMPKDDPIYDIPPDDMNLVKQNREIEEKQDILYDEIPAEYYIFENQQTDDMPTFDSSAKDFQCSPETQPPPRPPKSNQVKDAHTMKIITAEELAAEVQSFEQRQSELSEHSRRDSVDSFSSESTVETIDQNQHEPPELPPRTSVPIHRPFIVNSSTLGRFRSKNTDKLAQTEKRFAQSLRRHREETDSGISNQSSSGSDCNNDEQFLRRTVSMRSLTALGSCSPPQQRKSDKFLFSIGKLRKAGNKESQMFSSPPEINVDGQGRIWICDVGNNRIQSHEGTCGNMVSSFKTALNGVTLKPKGLTTMRNGTGIATSCGKYVIIWNEAGKFLHKYGPRADLGKLSGLAVDSQGSLAMADVENVQIGFENSEIKITAIGGLNTGKSTWPGRIAMNTLDQIIIADYNEHNMKIFNADGSLAAKFGRFGTEHGQMRYPSAVAVDRYNRIFVADECNSRITMFSCNGSVCYGDVLTRQDGINFPHAIAILPNGNIVISDDSKLVKVYKGREYKE